MAKFTFDINGILKSAKGVADKVGTGITSGLGSIGAGIGGGINTSLYANTKDADLTYTGDDYIVWDRIEAERVRRGLPGLASLGYPRPVDAPPPVAPRSAATPTVYEIEGPAGATVEQAREVFLKQQKTGSLVGLKPGDLLDANTQATAGLKSAQALVSSLPGGRSIPGSLPGLDAFGGPGDPVAQLTGLPGLADVPLQSAMNAADFVKQKVPNFSIGSLSPAEVQGLMAQTAATSGQSADAVTAVNGIGKYGLSLDKLEETGYIKPGTAQSYATTTSSVTQEDIDEAAAINAKSGDPDGITPEQVARNRALNNFLTPSAFTGKSGVSDVTSILGDSNLQSKIQGDVLKDTFSKLQQAGLSDAVKDPKKLAASLQTAAKFGEDDAKKFLAGQGIPDPTGVKDTAKAGEYAQAFASKFGVQLSSGGPLETSIKRPTGKTGTVNRDTIDAALSTILGSSKIPLPNFKSKPLGLYSNTKDEQLTYTGNDYIVWDRIEAERKKRGLPGLATLGYPRPPEDA